MTKKASSLLSPSALVHATLPQNPTRPSLAQPLPDPCHALAFRRTRPPPPPVHRRTLLDPTRLVADPTHLTSAIERNIDHRAPLLDWAFKHHAPAGVYDHLTTSGSMLEALGVRLRQTLRQIPSPDQVEARLAEQRRKLAARKAGARIVETTARPAVSTAVSKRPEAGKGVELKQALMPTRTPNPEP